MVHPFRCQICGETFLGQNPPERCPFCGVAGKNVLPAAEWKDYGRVEMSQQSKEDCQKALSLEITNAAYYKCAAENAENQITAAIFHRLMKQELEHAEVFADALGIEEPEEYTRTCFQEDAKNMVASNKHEVMAIKHYTQAANRATEPRIEQIFRALAEVENEHLIMTNMYIYRQ